MKFHSWFKSALKSNKYTLKKFAEEMNLRGRESVTYQQVHQWTKDRGSGGNEPSRENLIAIYEILGEPDRESTGKYPKEVPAF